LYIRAEDLAWMTYFATDPELSVASILEAVADRSALEQVLYDVKEVHFLDSIPESIRLLASSDSVAAVLAALLTETWGLG
jgi:hypothetical protein